MIPSGTGDLDGISEEQACCSSAFVSPGNPICWYFLYFPNEILLGFVEFRGGRNSVSLKAEHLTSKVICSAIFLPKI